MIRIVIDQHDEVGRWIFAHTPAQATWITGQGSCIGFVDNGTLIAGVAYTMFNGASVWCAVAQESSRWVNRTNLWAIFYYPFVQLGCRRISALVYGDNLKSQRFLEHLGFTREATLVDAAPNGDQFVYRLLKRDCLWLRDLRFKPSLAA